MRLNNKIKSWLSFLFGIGVLFVVIVSSVCTIAFDKDFYVSFYEREHLASQIGTEPEVLEDSIFSLLDYIEGECTEIADVFNEKEKKHMQDVRYLYNGFIFVRRICIVYMICTVLIFFWQERKHMFSYLAKGIVQASVLFLMMMAFLMLWAFTDFSDFWYRIHMLFFTNDLWILDPATDFMILICPENMFLNLCLRIVGLSGLILFCIILWSLWYLFKCSTIGFDKK